MKLGKIRAAALLAAGMIGLAGAPAHATLIAEETFDYSDTTTPDNLWGQGAAGSGWNGAWNQNGNGTWTSPGIDAGSLTYPGLASSGNKALATGSSTVGAGFDAAVRPLDGTYGTNTFNGVGDGSTIWLSFLMDLRSGTRFGGVSLLNNNTEVALIGKQSAASTFSIHTGAGANVSDDAAAGLHFLLLKIDLAAGADSWTLYVDPNLANGEAGLVNEVDATRTNITANFNGFRAAVGSATATATEVTAAFDEIRFGTTYADVAPASVATPEPTGLAFLGAAGLASLTRRRRRTCA